MLKVGRINFSFAAAHHLPNHDGLCKNLHGHNYKLEVEYAGQVSQRTGMLVDFKKIKDTVNSVISHLDHTCLNNLVLSISGYPFPSENPTAELMVQWMAKVLGGHPTVELNRIRLWETDNCYVEWTKD